MAASNGTGIFHYAWTRGFATVVEAPACQTAAVFGPGGWEQGQPSTVLPAGAPPGAEAVHLALPEWLADQIAGLQFSAGGLHTEFVRLNLLLQRLRSQGSDAAVLVLGEKPSVYVIAGGEVTRCGEDGAPPGEASGWIVVFSGNVRVPGVEPIRVEPPGAIAAELPDAGEEIYFVPTNSRSSLPEDVAEGILELAGPAGHAVPGLVDGSRTIATIASMTGLTLGQTRAVVGVLMAQRLAFRCVGRSSQALRKRS